MTDIAGSEARILSTVALHAADTTQIDRSTMSRAEFVRGVLSEATRHDVAVLRGSVGSSSLYDELLLAGVLARRGTPALLIGCYWEPGSRRLNRLFKLGIASRPTPGVDLLPPRATGIFTRLIGALDHPRIHYAVLSSRERFEFPEVWGVNPDRVHFTSYRTTIPEEATPLGSGPTVFSGGDSLRDYRALLKAAPSIRGDVFIATRLPMPRSRATNLTVRAVTPYEYTMLSRSAKVHVIPLLTESTRSAGQQTYLNAMALGRPVVVTDAPGVRDHIDDGATGLIVPQGDPKAMASAVNSLLADTAYAEQIGAAARQAVAENYTELHYTRQLRRIANTIAENR